MNKPLDPLSGCKFISHPLIFSSLQCHEHLTCYVNISLGHVRHLCYIMRHKSFGILEAILCDKMCLSALLEQMLQIQVASVQHWKQLSKSKGF